MKGPQPVKAIKIVDMEEFTPTERIAISIANDDYNELRQVEGYERFEDNPYPILNAVKFIEGAQRYGFEEENTTKLFNPNFQEVNAQLVELLQKL